jgi:hypothetical protein
MELKTAFYYGLLGNVTMFFWSADTFMGKWDRRYRCFWGAALLAPLPILWTWPLDSWIGVVMVPTLGHALTSGVIWGLTRKYIGKTG